MKIRTLFRLLVSGIILLPALVFLCVWVYFSIVLDLPSPPSLPPLFSRPFNPAIITFIIIGVISVFVIAMSILIARSITKSIMVLEETTRRIENGEFDIQIDAKGSNEITSLTASLNRMRNSLKQEENRRMLFLMGVTHDLKTPLALIKANVEAIEDGISSNPEEQYKSLGIINSKVDDMEGQINNLLDFVRIGDMQWKHNKEKVVLSTFMDDYAERTAMDAELLHRKVEKHIELKNTLVINMDKALVSRALDNIVNNSLQHCPPGGIITIGATLESVKQRDANRIVISIADNGPGIRESDLPHVFEIFYRGSLSRRENGQGLGLAVVKAIIDAHGWEIEALSSPGSGAVFRILIDSEEYIP